jgi:hypothetical protein
LRHFAFIALIIAAPLSAATISISNPSFESPGLGGAGGTLFAFGVTGGWTDTGTPITWNNAGYTSNIPFTSVPDGTQVAALGAAGGTAASNISQTLTTNLSAFTTYALSYYVGASNPVYGAYNGYRAVLSAGGVTLASDNTAVTPSNGTFLQDNLTFDSANATPAQLAVIGDPLTITFFLGSSNSTGGVVAFDLVQLTGTQDPGTAPEPSTWVLLGAGMGCLVLVRRKQG